MGALQDEMTMLSGGQNQMGIEPGLQQDMNDKFGVAATAEQPQEKGFFATAWDAAKNIASEAVDRSLSNIERDDNGDVKWGATLGNLYGSAQSDGGSEQFLTQNTQDQAQPVETHAEAPDAEQLLNALRSRMNQG